MPQIMLVKAFKGIILYSYLVCYLESTNIEHNPAVLHVSDSHMAVSL